MAGQLKLTILGAHGRMGQALVALARLDPMLAIVGLVVRAGSPVAGGADPVTGIRYETDLAAALARCDVAIEFVGAGSVAATAAGCVATGKPLVSGSTGLDADGQAALEAATAKVAVLQAANFSPGVTVLNHLVAQAAGALPGFEIGIEETHHLRKKDSPSGTALRLREAVEAGRGPGATVTVRSRREGEVVGDHRVTLSGPGERLELAHHASDRAIFARGALSAARWLAGRPAGRYAMDDVLGLRGKALAR